MRPEQKSPTETAASDCCSTDSRPNSRGSSLDIRLGHQTINKSRDVDSDEGINDFECEVRKVGSATSSASIATSTSPQGNGTTGCGSGSNNNNNGSSKSALTGASPTNNSNLNGGGSKRKKKTRTVFSRSQVFQLESTFDVKRYLSSSERAGLAASLHLTETQVSPSSFLLPSSTSIKSQILREPCRSPKEHLILIFFLLLFNFSRFLT